MPAPTKLDKLVEQLRGFAKPKADIIKPYGKSLPGRSTPDRLKYQNGIGSIQGRNVMKAQNQLDDFEEDKEALESQWSDAVDEAKDAMYDDWRNTLDYNDFSDIDPDYLEVEEPALDLRDFWNDIDYPTPDEFRDKAERLDEEIDEWGDIVEHRESPEYRMELQRQSPRYRNYQRAMADRAANQRLGHQIARYKAEVQRSQIMRLRQMGYSPAQIRAMMTGQYPMPMGGF